MSEVCTIGCDIVKAEVPGTLRGTVSKREPFRRVINVHGIAVIHSTMNGNTSDIAWNKKALVLIKNYLMQVSMKQFVSQSAN